MNMIVENTAALSKYCKIESLTPEIGDDGADRLAIAFCVDAKYIPHAGVCILSILKNNIDEFIDFYIISSENLSDSYHRLIELVKDTPHKLSVCCLRLDIFNTLPSSDLFPVSIYYRLLLPYILSDKNRVLYLDADIVCLRGFVSELLSLNIENYPACVVKEPLDTCLELASEIGIDNMEYFNSGVILINTQRWRELNISVKAFSILNRRGDDFGYPDQDALNLILEGNVMFLPPGYNHIVKLGNGADGLSCHLPSSTVFIHYTGSEKPWKIWNDQHVSLSYRQNYRISPWAGVPFQQPENNRDAKKMYKYYLRNRKFLMSIKWYAQYFFMRYVYRV